MSDGPGYVDDLLLDLSHYDLATFDAPCLYAKGVRRVILGTYSRNATIQMIVGCRAAGIQVVGLYGLPYFGNNDYYVNRDIDAAIAIAKQYGIGTVWVDAEIDAWQIGVDVPPSNPSQRTAQLQGQLDKVTNAGLRAGIYTAKWWWSSGIGNGFEFAKYPLWHAIYTGNGSPVPNPGFGGWTSAEIHQYTSTRELCGRGRDANYLFTEVDAESIEEDDMAAIEELEKRIAELERRTGGTDERARNADLLLYADGLNDALTEHLEEADAEGDFATGLKRGDTVVLK